MQLNVSLAQKQTTSLMMTPELRVAISLLQYSVFDLLDFIQEQASSNPLIELDMVNSKEAIAEKSFSRSNDYAQNATTYTNNTDSPLDYLNLERPTLHDYLLAQARLLSIKQIDHKHLIHFISYVTDNGYLSSSVEELSKELNITIDQGEFILHLLQDLEPVGIGARTLQECIQLQLNKMSERNSLAELIVREHFENFSLKKWNKISKELSVNMQKIQQVQDLIQTLEPRPGAYYNSDVTNYAIPEISVTKELDQLFVVLNDEFIPKINLSDEYRELINEKSSEAYAYLREKHNEFKWLHQSLAQRQSTLYKVANAIVTHQKDFFTEGIKSLKPLTLVQIAEEIDVHESTISRVTSNKYMETPRGVFELKYFFTAGIDRDDQVQVTSTYIKELIKTLIDREDKSKPLSDQDLVSAINLKERVKPSRRVIAKYRNEMRIPSSLKRRRFPES